MIIDCLFELFGPSNAYFQYFDYDFFIINNVYTLEDLAVLAAAQLAHNLIVVLVAPLDYMRLVVPIFARLMRIGICVDARLTRRCHIKLNETNKQTNTKNEQTNNQAAAKTLDIYVLYICI